MSGHEGVIARLAEAGFDLPAAMPAVATYVPTVATPFGQGMLVHVAGQGPFRDGRLEFVGRIGDGINLEVARRSAELVTLNVLAQVAAATDGHYGAPSLHRVRCVRLGVFLNCIDGFEVLDTIADAASKIVVAAFEEKGQHCRSVVGKPVLPMDTSVEIDGIFLLD